ISVYYRIQRRGIIKSETMRLVQFKTPAGEHRVGLVREDENSLQLLQGITRVYDLALEADRRELGLEQVVNEYVSRESVDYDQLMAENRLLPPLDHPDPAHCYVSGTGLDHLGSAQARDAMHTKLSGDPSML